MIYVINCGYDSYHEKSFKMTNKEGNNDYLLLLVKTDGVFKINNRTIHTKPNTVVLYNKHTPTWYGGNTDYYSDDWIHFDFTDDSGFLSSLSIPFDKPFTVPYLNNLTEYVKLLAHESQADMKNRMQIQNQLMHAILLGIDEQITAGTAHENNKKHYLAFGKLRTLIYNNPSGSYAIPLISKEMNISSSYFQHIYSELFGISFTKDVIKARISRAKLYLCTTDHAIKWIAASCGYENETHFMRQFKKLEGITPSSYRSIALSPYHKNASSP